MDTGKPGPGTKKLILFGAAVAIPLAAVALYFALFDQPPPATRGSQPPPASAAPAGSGDGGQAALPPNHPPIGRAAGAQPGPGGGQSGESAAPSGQGMSPGHPQTGGAGRPVRVPDSVKGKWQAVKVRVEQKSGGKAPEVFTIKLGGQLDIPGSKLRVRVNEFLPALQVSGNEVTSASNEPSNPAALVTVWDAGKEAFRGWIFSRFPEMQPFEHPLYRVTLVEGVPKG
jgi:hypothetical protein